MGTGSVVYGPAQTEFNFLTKLVDMCSHEQLPLLIGGDFIILRSLNEKNNDNYDQHWPFFFNVVIDGLNLRDVG